MRRGNKGLARLQPRAYSKRRVPKKPFNTNYRIPAAGGYIVFNGEQITRIRATRMVGEDNSWEVIFYLTDGYTHVIHPNSWTRAFVRDVFDLDENE